MENSRFYFKEKSVKVGCDLYAEVCYENLGGYTNTAIFKFISYSTKDGDSYLWLTANGNVNYMYLCTDWSGYSFESNRYKDISNYIKKYMTDSGYVIIKDIKWDWNAKSIEKMIKIGKFEQRYTNCITGESWNDKFEFLVDTNRTADTDIYILQKSTGNMRFLTTLTENDTNYADYCADNMDAAEYFFEK